MVFHFDQDIEGRVLRTVVRLREEDGKCCFDGSYPPPWSFLLTGHLRCSMRDGGLRPRTRWKRRSDGFHPPGMEFHFDQDFRGRVLWTVVRDA